MVGYKRIKVCEKKNILFSNIIMCNTKQQIDINKYIPNNNN